MRVIRLTEVDYQSWREGPREITGAREEIRNVVEQTPAWEVVDTSDLVKTPLAVRLAPLTTARPNMHAMYEWLKSMGTHSVIFCEAAAIMRQMSLDSNFSNLVCLGSLWLVDGELCYAGWQNGKLHLFPFGHTLEEDYFCPILNQFRPIRALPERAAHAVR
ncbi:MAG: hypothetical protein ABIH36_00535 [bacterium]